MVLMNKQGEQISKERREKFGLAPHDKESHKVHPDHGAVAGKWHTLAHRLDKQITELSSALETTEARAEEFELIAREIAEVKAELVNEKYIQKEEIARLRKVLKSTKLLIYQAIDGLIAWEEFHRKIAQTALASEPERKEVPAPSPETDDTNAAIKANIKELGPQIREGFDPVALVQGPEEKDPTA